MPIRFNTDHQTQIIAGVGILPGDPYDFTNEEIAAGIAGQWATTDPRQGLPAERVFKARRDAPVADQAAVPVDTSEPASDGEKEV